MLYLMESALSHKCQTPDVGDENYEYTIYYSCWNARRGIYYYKTYDRHRITAVDMHREDLSGSELITYPMLQEEEIYVQN